MTKIAQLFLSWKIKRLIAARGHLEHQLALHKWAIIDINDEIRRLEFVELATRIDAK
jgi:hypothetical protein